MVIHKPNVWQGCGGPYPFLVQTRKLLSGVIGEIHSSKPLHAISSFLKQELNVDESGLWPPHVCFEYY